MESEIDGILEELSNDLNNLFGDKSVGRLSNVDSLCRVDSWVSSRSIVVDSVLRGGGPVGSPLVPFGRQMEISGPENSGKCLRPDTPVLRFDGKIVRVDSLEEGDQLMGPDSLPRTVSRITRGNDDMFRVTPKRGGEAFECNSVHVLTVQNSRTEKIFDVPLNEYINWPDRKKREACLLRKEVNFKKQEPLPVDPWLFGVWVAEGSKGSSSIRFTNPEEEIQQVIIDKVQKEGCTARIVQPRDRCVYVAVSCHKRGKNSLFNRIRWLNQSEGLEKVKTASRKEREEFLAGVIDGDGYVKLGTTEVVQVNKIYAETIAFVARSLGFMVSVTERFFRLPKWKEPRLYHRVFITGTTIDLPIILNRKKATAKKNWRRTRFDVEPMSYGEYFGFMLDGDGRFLLGDFTVTHNTTLCAHIAAETQDKGGIVIVTDSEERIDVPYWTNLGVDTSRILHLHARSIEDVFDKQFAALNKAKELASNRLILMIWDSLGGTSTANLIDSKSKETPMEQAKSVYGRQAAEISAGMRLVNEVIAETNACYLYTNHLYHKMNVKYGDPYETYGGNKPKYFATVRLRLKPVAQLQESDNFSKDALKNKKTIGMKILVKAIKNQMSGILLQREAYILAGKGFSNEMTIFEMAKSLKIIKTRGSWSEWESPTGEIIKFQGFNGFINKITSRPEYSTLENEIIRTL